MSSDNLARQLRSSPIAAHCMVSSLSGLGDHFTTVSISSVECAGSLRASALSD